MRLRTANKRHKRGVSRRRFADDSFGWRPFEMTVHRDDDATRAITVSIAYASPSQAVADKMLERLRKVDPIRYNDEGRSLIETIAIAVLAEMD